VPEKKERFRKLRHAESLEVVWGEKNRQEPQKRSRTKKKGKAKIPGRKISTGSKGGLIKGEKRGGHSNRVKKANVFYEPQRGKIQRGRGPSRFLQKDVPPIKEKVYPQQEKQYHYRKKEETVFVEVPIARPIGRITGRLSYLKGEDREERRSNGGIKNRATGNKEMEESAYVNGGKEQRESRVPKGDKKNCGGGFSGLRERKEGLFSREARKIKLMRGEKRSF